MSRFAVPIHWQNFAIRVDCSALVMVLYASHHGIRAESEIIIPVGRSVPIPSTVKRVNSLGLNRKWMLDVPMFSNL
jgi:hypothetical protein